MVDAIKKLEVIFADTYALYLKTQNYHWHVRGANFKTLHELFEEQYKDLAEAVDSLAERLIMLGHKAPASFSQLDAIKTIKDGNSSHSANQMVHELEEDHNRMIKEIHKALSDAEEQHDEGTVDLLSSRIAVHEKARWMLGATVDNA